MPHYRQLQACIPLLLLGYAAVALAAIPTRHHELFPFFCWFLFPVTPATEQRYELQLHEVAGRQLTQPTAYAHATRFVEQPHSMDAYVAVQNLGRALSAGDREAAARNRRILEANFLSSPCRYDLVYRRQDAYALWHGGQPPAERRLASFACRFE